VAESKSIEVTPEKITAGIEFLMEFFAAEWGGTKGITCHEARAVVKGIVAAMAEPQSPSAPDLPALLPDANTPRP
jgi:hypothetical protein